jgi:hypothetical protein
MLGQFEQWVCQAGKSALDRPSEGFKGLNWLMAAAFSEVRLQPVGQ